MSVVRCPFVFLAMRIAKRKDFISEVIIIAAIAIMFYLAFSYRTKVNAGIAKNRETTIAYTTNCNKNVKSSMHTLYYKFEYNGQTYSGSTSFNKGKRGDICRGVRYWVEFDSTYPMYNNLLLDSALPVVSPKYPADSIVPLQDSKIK